MILSKNLLIHSIYKLFKYSIYIFIILILISFRLKYYIKISNDISCLNNYIKIDSNNYYNLIYKEININKDLGKILDKYSSFKDVLINATIKVPLEDGFCPQGITVVKNNIVISGYYDDKKYTDIFIYNNQTKEFKKIKIDIKTHAGSIAYDERNELLWIPGDDGILYAYDVDDLFKNDYINNKYKIDYVKNKLLDYQYSNKYNIAYLTIDNDYIYIGNFYQSKKCLVKKYYINNFDGLKLEYDSEFYLSSRVQGISLYHEEDKVYMITSNSYNRHEKSTINIYLYKNGIKDYSKKQLKSIVIPPMSEQISIYKKFGLIIFESGAQKYIDSYDKIKYICVFDLEKILYNKHNNNDYNS